MSFATRERKLLCSVAAAALLLTVAPAAVHAETAGDKDAKIRRLESMMETMQAEIRSLKTSVHATAAEQRRARTRVVERPAAPLLAAGPGAYPVLAPGEAPAIVTADKKLRFGSITITPGGFLAAESVYRSRTTQSDIGTAYQNIPFGSQGSTNEFRFTARQSRIAALVEAPITPSFLVAGYGELDFLGSGVTSNENESNSFVPRIRHLYATLDNADYGMHVLAGQTWSLATMNSKGITPRNEVTPPTIDSQYVPGFVWKRQPQIRLTKDFGKTLWVSVSAEEPQNTIAGCGAAGVNAVAVPNQNGINNSVTCQLVGSNNLNNTTAFSLDHAPDVVGKVAYEAKLADRDVHFEAFGLYKNLYDRVAYNSGGGVLVNGTNVNSHGYGVGGGLIVPVLPKRLDFQLSGIYGRGVGSYGTAQFSDATFDPNGGLSPIRQESLLAGLTLHATPAIDLYAFGGVEQVQPDNYTTNPAGTAFGGYGIPTANNSGCYQAAGVVGGAAVCAGNAKRIWQITGGMWDKLYKGAFGEVRVGVQYSYTKRELFEGNGATAPLPALGGTPKTDDHIVLTSLRYYPFQ